MEFNPQDEQENLPMLLTEAYQTALQYIDNLSQHPAGSVDSVNTLSTALSQTGLGTQQTLKQFQQDILPYLSGSVGSRYWGFVTGGVTPAAMVGDWLTAATDQNVMVGGDSIATAVELAVIEQLKALFSLPEKGFDGVLTTGATASNLVCLATARQWGGRKLGYDIAREGFGCIDQFQIFAATPHASQIKIQGILGFGQNHWTKVKGLLDANGKEGEAMDIKDLEYQLQTCSAPIKIVISSAATVSTTAFDNFSAIAQLCKTYQAWHHVDGAFGLFARCSPQFANLAIGAELADSITVDCHKWLNVPYDCGVVFTQHRQLLEETFTCGAAYLNTDTILPKMMNRGIENSRRFRALPVWFTLTAYGKAGIQNIIENSCNLAVKLAEWIRYSQYYDLILYPQFNVVLFAGNFKGNLETVNQQNRNLLTAINQTGKVFLTPGNYYGKFCFRAAFSNWRITDKDIIEVTQILEQVFPV
ncbi:MAG: pyridoxal-dependent decarboxylase [Microcoleaceae cyanobacterium]